MKCFIYVVLAFLSCNMQSKCYCYSNDEGDCLIVQNDTLFLRLSNKDAFNTYSMFYGLGDLEVYRFKKSRNRINLGKNLISTKFVELHTDNRHNHNTKIILQRSDNTVLEFTSVSIYDNIGNNIYNGVCDLNGELEITQDIAQRCRSILIQSLESTIKLESQLTVNGINKIQCLIRIPYTEIDSKHINAKSGDSMITINYHKRQYTLYREEFQNINSGATFISDIACGYPK